jgi:hypothetical protein
MPPHTTPATQDHCKHDDRGEQRPLRRQRKQPRPTHAIPAGDEYEQCAVEIEAPPVSHSRQGRGEEEERGQAQQAQRRDVAQPRMRPDIINPIAFQTPRCHALIVQPDARRCDGLQARETPTKC